MNELMRLPELGENIESGQLVAITVKEGDPVSEGQILFEVETDKVVVEVPAKCSGIIKKILVKTNTPVATGDVLAEVVCDESTESDSDIQASNEIQDATEDANSQTVEPEALIKPPDLSPTPTHILTSPDKRAPAGPASRNLARKLGIDISHVLGSGRNGRIGKPDVLAYAKELIANSRSRSTPPLPDDSRFGPLRKQQANSVQLATADNMSNAWQQIPHAWLQAEFDITALESQRQNSSESGRSLTAYLIKALANAIIELPLFSASWDELNSEVVYRNYIDINIAVDTPKGLLIPAVRAADQKTIDTLSDDIKTLAATARAGKLSKADMRGGCMTLSNLGGFGLTSIQPIVNWPQAAILGVATSQWRQTRSDKGDWQEALMLPITLGFDHRMINGADAARFIEALRKSLVLCTND